MCLVSPSGVLCFFFFFFSICFVAFTDLRARAARCKCARLSLRPLHVDVCIAFFLCCLLLLSDRERVWLSTKKALAVHRMHARTTRSRSSLTPFFALANLAKYARSLDVGFCFCSLAAPFCWRKQQHLERKSQLEVTEAKKKLGQKNRRGAMMCLKRKKAYEAQIGRLSGARMTLEEQVMAIESANVNLEVSCA